MDSLPAEAFRLVYAFLPADDRLKHRRVSRRWAGLCAEGCGHIVVAPSAMRQVPRATGTRGWAPERHRPKTDEPKLSIRSLLLRGGSGSGQGSSGGDDTAGANVTNSNMYAKRKRTRGHLPEPIIIPESSSNSTCICLEEVCPSRLGVAFHALVKEEIANNGDAIKPLRSLDLPKSVAMFSDITNDNIRRMRALKTIVKEIDLCSLTHLERVSVRGCSNLEVLCLPPGILALDASSCTRLKKISMRRSGHVSGDNCYDSATTSDDVHVGRAALNLNGCRSLSPHGVEGEIFGPGTDQFTRNLAEADLSSTLELTDVSIANMLRSATNLASLSLRYVATDVMLNALAQSNAAASSLCLVDVAFSQRLTDATVQLIATKATHLERMNLRGCRSISTACYNEVPIALQKRLLNRKLGREIPMDDVLKRSKASNLRAKGDNIFFFDSVGVGEKN